ncbi:MAG: addiction module protein [Coriobacteriia bacterium]|nr:addiction module protein [Coriobacteriia bacterium]MDO9107881.1 addiction module protein [Coriobacteriia bacterium]MDZ4064744.1 addiction module protein [Coriobacteriia bacterium]
MTITELKSIALSLSPEERAELASDLLLSLDSLSEHEIEHLWLEEASRRDAEIDAGTAKLIPGDQVFAEARARLK